MPHGILPAFNGTGGAPPPPPVTITFNPPGDSYEGDSIIVVLTVTGAAKLRYKIDTAGWTTFNGLSTTVTVNLTFIGKTLYCDALDSAGAVLLSDSAIYSKESGGAP